MREFWAEIREDRHGMEDLEARARQRIMEAVDADKFTQRALGKAAGYGDTGIGLILNGKRGMPLQVLQAAADLLGVDPAEFIADPRALVKVLSPFEAEVLRYVRDWPPSTREAFATFLRYFAGQGAYEDTVRRAVEYLRAMRREDRHRAEAYLLMLSDGTLPQDYRAKVTPPDSIDALLEGVPPADVALVRAMAQKARTAVQKDRRRKHG
jgi:transcriptional regulator with XRE-family HTH domain